METISPPHAFSQRIIESLQRAGSTARWEQLIVSLLQRLELEPSERADAEIEYLALADHIARRLDLPRHSVNVYPQGSMRTQTTISPRGNAKFDIDIMVELEGPRYFNPNSEAFFAEFGKALEGNEEVTGVPSPKRRCWRLQYPDKPYYFDVTPAVPDPIKLTGAALRVRDPKTSWSPSNPKEFAQWFCDRADLQLKFESATGLGLLMEKSVTPLPDTPVRIDDILRRTVQLLKLHRDNFYHFKTPERKEASPISVVIVTLAANAFEYLLRTRGNAFTSPIELVLAIVEEIPGQLRTENGKYVVANPTLHSENFADRWNNDNGARSIEFRRWYEALEADLEMLLTSEYSSSKEHAIRAVFGQVGIEAWKASCDVANDAAILRSLLASSGVKSNPSAATPVSHNRTTLA